jgi:UDP-N-acetyl-D-glucosamine dehydrogenase
MKRAGRFDATADFSRLKQADAIIVCVPTPLGHHLEPDVSFIERAADDIARTLRPGQLVVLESSTYPGTTREVMLPRCQKTGLMLGQDFFMAFSPERVDPGNPTFQTKNTPKVVGGVTPAFTEHAVALYKRFLDTVVPVSHGRRLAAAAGERARLWILPGRGHSDPHEEPGVLEGTRNFFRETLG